MKSKNALTMALKRIVKANGRMFVHFERDWQAESWSDKGTFTLTAYKRDHDDPRTTVDLPGSCGNGHTDDTETHTYDGRTWTTYGGRFYRPQKGFWSFWSDTFRDAVLSVPNDAELSLRVSLDGGTSECHVPVKFHTDRIYLVARFKRGSRDVERVFLLDSSTGPHNTARFGYGSEATGIQRTG